MTLDQLLAKMCEDWDARACLNAMHYIATGQSDWNVEAFYESGELFVALALGPWLPTIHEGRPWEARVLEIGCGAGRLTRALSHIFGEVHAVDVSGEMVKIAREACPQAHIHQNNGMDLRVVPNDQPFDLAICYLVFQHIPSYAVIESYMRETHRLLRPGAPFWFQVQGAAVDAQEGDTWVGVGFSEEQLREMAGRCGWDAAYIKNSGTQECLCFWYRDAGGLKASSPPVD